MPPASEGQSSALDASLKVKPEVFDPSAQIINESEAFHFPNRNRAEISQIMQAMRDDSGSRFEKLNKEFPLQHFFKAEVDSAIISTSERKRLQDKINQQEVTVLEWLRSNATEGDEFDLEGSGTNTDFYLFFKSQELYSRFCEATGEKLQVQNAITAS